MPKFTPPDPGWETRVRDSFGRQGLMRHLKARITRVEPGLVEIEIAVRRRIDAAARLFPRRRDAVRSLTRAGGYAAYSLFLPTVPC